MKKRDGLYLISAHPDFDPVKVNEVRISAFGAWSAALFTSRVEVAKAVGKGFPGQDMFALVDGDNFYVSCERILVLRYRGVRLWLSPTVMVGHRPFRRGQGAGYSVGGAVMQVAKLVSAPGSGEILGELYFVWRHQSAHDGDLLVMDCPLEWRGGQIAVCFVAGGARPDAW